MPLFSNKAKADMTVIIEITKAKNIAVILMERFRIWTMLNTLASKFYFRGIEMECTWITYQAINE